MRKYIVIIFVFFLTLINIYPQEIQFFEINNKSNILYLNVLPSYLVDSVNHYSKSPIDAFYYFEAFDKYFFRINLKSEFLTNEDDDKVLCSIDSDRKHFTMFKNSISSGWSHIEFFLKFKEGIYMIDRKNRKSKKTYMFIFKIDKYNINNCKEYRFQQQDITFFISNKGWFPKIECDDGLLKVYIKSYKMEFDYAWLFLWWAPRGAPEKWKIEYDSRKDYCYTLDENLNLISIEEIPIMKEDY